MRALLILAALLSGCASTEYKQYAEAQANIAAQRAAAEQARYAAIAAIAAQGDATSKVAAVMAMSMMQQAPTKDVPLAPPRSAGETLLSWAQLILPTATQFYSIGRQAAVATRQSDNSARVAVQQSQDASITTTNIVNGFVAMGSKIQGNTTTTSTTTTTTPTQVIEKPSVVLVDKPLLVDKPVLVTVDKPLIVKPEIVTVDKPVIVQPTVIQVPAPAPTPGN